MLVLFRLHFAVFYLLKLNMQVLAVESSFEVLALSLRPISSKVLVLVLVLVLGSQVLVLCPGP